MGYIHTGSQTATLSHFRGFGVVSVLYMDLHNNHRKFSSSPFIFLFYCSPLQTHRTPTLSHFTGKTLSLTDTATVVSLRHSHISLHISSLRCDIFIFLSLHPCDHMLQLLSAGFRRSQSPCSHYHHLSLSAFYSVVIIIIVVIIFTCAKLVHSHSYGFGCVCNWREYFFYETFCALLLFYYREGSWEGGGSSLFPGRTP